MVAVVLCSEGSPSASDPCAEIVVHKEGGVSVDLRRREHEAKVVDFIQFFNAHELPELRLRLTEMGDFVDEMHIAEGDRNFAGHAKPYLWPDASKNDPIIEKYSHKIIYHQMKVPPFATSYAIQEAILKAMDQISGTGVLSEGDLDEILSRDLLRAMRMCEPADGLGWNANAAMKLFAYNFGWKASELWENPPLIRDFGVARPTASFLQVKAKPSGDRVITHYIHRGKHRIFRRDGRVVGWHISWTLDGAEGVAEKILNGHIEGTPDWARPYVDDRDKLVRFLRDQFLPNPQQFHPGLVKVDLEKEELPETSRENKEVFSALLPRGEGSSR